MKPKQTEADPAITANVILCCQFDSEFYDFEELKTIAQRAVDAADEREPRVDVLFACLDDGAPGVDIQHEIKEAIGRASVVILEVSDQNPNVLMELGAAWVAEKQMIILREKGAVDRPLPFNISGLRWVEYRRDRLQDLQTELAKKVAGAIHSLDLDELAPDSVDRFLAKHFRVITTTEDLTTTMRDQLTRCERNFYYIGSASLTPITDELLDLYRENLGDISSHRIVYMRSVRDVLGAPDLSRQDAVEHCIWLARYYRLVRDGVMNLYHSDAVGHSGVGISLVVYDQEEVVLTLGRLVRKMNHRALTISDESFAIMTHGYATQLMARAEHIEVEDFGRYFAPDASDADLPAQIADVIDADLDALREAARAFVRELERG